MRLYIRAGMAAAAMALGITAAAAADIPARQALPAKAPLYVAPVAPWTGFYIGINGGGAFGRSSFSAPFATGRFDVNGAVIGGTAGYNWQQGPVVFGVEGDIDWSNIRGSAVCGGTTCRTHNDWLGTFRGRLGYTLTPQFLPYITGGLAVGNMREAVVGIGHTDNTKVGWTIGAGLEARISGPWSAKVEYLFVDLGRGDSILGSSAKLESHIVRAGLNYRF